MTASGKEEQSQSQRSERSVVTPVFVPRQSHHPLRKLRRVKSDGDQKPAKPSDNPENQPKVEYIS